MNDRVAKLREQSLKAVPYVSIERALLVNEVYQQHEGSVPIPVLRALCFKNLMEKKKIFINPGELIVGERGEAPAATPTYPELCCHTIEDFEIMHTRKKISFKVDEKVRRTHKEKIIPYWQKRSIRSRIWSEMDEEWKTAYEAGIFTEFMEQRGPGHTVADDKIYRKGFLDFKKEIEDAIASLDVYNDLAAYDRKAQLQAMAICCDAVVAHAARYVELARKMAAKEKNRQRKAELLRIAETCERVPARAPRTFVEALQMYWFVHYCVVTEMNNWDSFCPGRLDQHLYPFYSKEVEAGSLTREQAKEILECFWVKFNNQPAPPKVGITLKESGTYTDFCNINIGGVKIDGNDGVNDVSYLLLEVIEEMKILQPSTNVQISRKSPHEFVKAACKVIRRGYGQPSMFNADAVIEEMVRCGKTIDDARCGGTSGCVETGCFGKEAYILTGYFNLPKVLEITLMNGVDSRTGRKIGLETGDPCKFKSYDELFEAFRKQLRHFIDIKMKGNNIIERLYAKYMPVPFLSIIISDCIKNGKDYNEGGARYNTSLIQGVGIGSITDSLSALKKHVFEDGNFMMKDILRAMKADFKGFDEIQNLVCNHTPKYGNDDDYADTIMRSVFEEFFRMVDGRKNMRGGEYHILMLPTTCHIYFGSVTGAMPDGRKAWLPVSEGISPAKGADRKGPTAVLKSAGKMDHLRTCGTLLNQKFTPQSLEGDVALDKLAYLVRSYFKMDGHHIQFNVVDKSMLLDAQKHPEQYHDLIVRVAGYSDYFNNLDKALQDEIINRTEHDF